MDNKFGKGKGSVNYKLLIALVLMKEWGLRLNAYKIIQLNRKYNLECFKASKPTIYKYIKEVETFFNDVKSDLKSTKFLEEYRD
ncbi:MAG: hypothetical protein QXO07_01320 [Candidatus Aenigmatarchaeota archaeon]